MKETRKIGKRLLAAVLAVAMAATTMGTQVFAFQEEGGAEPAAEESGRVLSWTWPDDSAVVWAENTQSWTMTCATSATMPLTQEALSQLLPKQVTAVVQTAETATAEVEEEEVNQPTATPKATATPKPTATPAATATPQPTATAQPTVSPEATAEPTATPAADSTEEDVTVEEPNSEEISTNETAVAAAAAVEEESSAEEEPLAEEESSAEEEVRTPQRKSAPSVATDENAAEPAAATSQSLALDLTWNFDGLKFPLQAGDYTLTATLPQGYQLAEGTPALQLKLHVEGVSTMARAAARAINQDVLDEHTISNVISPSNVTIDLFDYAAPSEAQFPIGNNGNINDGHYLWFSSTGTGTKGTSINAWTSYPGDSARPNGGEYAFVGGPFPGMVQDTLGSDGYPVLEAGNQYNASSWARTTQQSLNYLFDNSQVSGKTGYYDVKGLLQLDPDTGIMSYDSQKNFAEFDADTNEFVLYDKSAVNGNGSADQQTGQFFPFNTASDVFEQIYDWNDGWTITDKGLGSGDSTLNHFFGMHMKAYFMQPDNGKLTTGDDMTFTFSGDDDVWLFIDGVLIGDVGGIHDRVQLTINFATGNVEIKNGAQYAQYYPNLYSKTTTIAQLVQDAGANIELQGNTLADGTYHTLDFFYLERGAGNSNLRLETNLVEIPVSSVIKVDQLGHQIPDVDFELYQTSNDYNIANGTLIAEGTTNQSGTLVLEGKDGQPINFADLANTSPYFVLHEKEAPAGYRSTGDINLRYEELGANQQGVLLSSNSWTSGSWAATTMQASRVSGRVETAADSAATIQLPDDGSAKLFAVIMKREGEGNPKDPSNKWYAISGDVLNGWSLSENPITDAGQFTTSQKHYFKWDATTGRYTLQFDSLPGDITKYYYMLGNGDAKNETVYTIGYYYEAPNGQVTRLNSDEFSRQYAINAYVTNVKNYLFVQKVDESGKVLPAGAEFALYPDTQVALNEDGTYKTLTGDPYDTVTIGEEQDDGYLIGDENDAIAYFPNNQNILQAGTYYLVETSAPAGYTVNKKAVKIIVDETGVYADAGDVGDGITTLVGVGSLVDSMAQFGSGLGNGLDQTLADIIVNKQTAQDESLDWQDNSDSLYLSRKENTKVEYAPTEGKSNTYYFTSDEDWTRIGSIRQNYNDGVDTTNKTNLQELGNPDVRELFSHTTVVRVADTPIGLTITKAVEGGTVTPDKAAGQYFYFKVTKLNDQGAVDGTYAQTVQLVSGTTETDVTFVGGVLDGTKLPITGTGSITLQGLAEGKYKVEEIVAPTAPADITDGDVLNQWKEVTYTVTGDENAQTVPATDNTPAAVIVNVTAANAAEDASVVVNATNHYDAYKTLTVTKTVTGDLGDKTKVFNFTLNVSTKDADGQPVPYTQALANKKGTTGEALQDGQDLTASAGSNLYSFTLTDSQTIQITVPYNATVSVAEDLTGVTGYETSSSKYPTQTPNSKTNGQESQTINLMNADYTVDFVNTCDMRPPTGLHSETRPYTAMVGLAGVAALVGIAGWVELRRRKRREQE